MTNHGCTVVDDDVLLLKSHSKRLELIFILTSFEYFGGKELEITESNQITLQSCN